MIPVVGPDIRQVDRQFPAIPFNLFANPIEGPARHDLDPVAGADVMDVFVPACRRNAGMNRRKIRVLPGRRLSTSGSRCSAC